MPASSRSFLMRQLQEIIEQAEFVHHLERRGMDRVAAKIAQEIGMFLQHDHIDAGARQQKPEHHPGRSAADDAAAAGDCLRGLVHAHLPKKSPSKHNTPIVRFTDLRAVENRSTAPTRIATRMFAAGASRPE